MKTPLLTALLAAALVLSAPAVHAQVGFGVGAGPSVPTGGLSDVVDAGFHGGILADVRIPLLPVGARADLMYQHLPGVGDRDAFQQISGTVNARLSLLPLPLVSAYLLGGVGLYGSLFDEGSGPAGQESWSTDVGLNAGVGARVNLLVLRPFLEVRYHHVTTDPTRSFVPVTLGVVF